MFLLKNNPAIKWIQNNMTEWCGWRLVYMLVVLTDMLVFIPFDGYEFLKAVKNDEWREEHKTLSIILLVHMNSAAVLGLFIHGILKCSTKITTAITMIERILSSVLLLFVVIENQAEAWENGMMWFSIMSMGNSICMGCLTFVTPDKERVDDLRFLTVTLKTWIPAVAITAVSTAAICAIPATFTDLHVGEQILYTLGMEVLLSAAYFITVYETFNACTKRPAHETNREDKLLSDEINV